MNQLTHCASWQRKAVTAAVVVPLVGVQILGLAVVLAEPVASVSGIFTSAGLRKIQSAPSRANESVQSAIARKYSFPTWRAFHKDSPTDVYVVCEATRPDGTHAKLVWYVKGSLTWSLHSRVVAVSAINREAFDLAPQLLEPGRTVYPSPDTAY